MFRADHSLDMQIQSFIGGGKAGAGHGFAWEPGQLSHGQLVELERVISAIGSRLRQEIGGDLEPRESREAVLLSEIARLKNTVGKQKKLMRIAEEQLRLNAVALRKLKGR